MHWDLRAKSKWFQRHFLLLFGPRMECGIKGKNGCIIIYNYFPSACKMGLWKMNKKKDCYRLTGSLRPRGVLKNERWLELSWALGMVIIKQKLWPVRELNSWNRGPLNIEGCSVDALLWAECKSKVPRGVCFVVNEIEELSCSMEVIFRLSPRSLVKRWMR